MGAAVQHRVSQEDMYRTDRPTYYDSDDASPPEYLPWTASTGEKSMRTMLLNQVCHRVHAGLIKVRMLTHTYPHKLPGKIKVVICYHRADSLLVTFMICRMCEWLQLPTYLHEIIQTCKPKQEGSWLTAYITLLLWCLYRYNKSGLYV